MDNGEHDKPGQEEKNNEREKWELALVEKKRGTADEGRYESLPIDHETTDGRSSSEQAVVFNVCGDNNGTRWRTGELAAGPMMIEWD